MTDKTVLLLSFDNEKLKTREALLRESGFNVVPVHSPTQARFEIEMGRCDIFVTCRLVPDIVNRDLTALFRQHCPGGGVVVLVTNDQASPSPYEPEVDIRVPESNDPKGVIEALQAKFPMSEAS
jgi:hypothetical protein